MQQISLCGKTVILPGLFDMDQGKLPGTVSIVLQSGKKDYAI